MHYAARRSRQRDREIRASRPARDALGHSHSAENSRGTTFRAVNIRTHVSRRSIDRSCFSPAIEPRRPPESKSNLRVIAAAADYQGVRDLFMITVV